MKSNAAVLREPTEADDLAAAGPATIESVTVDDPRNDEVLVEIAAAGLCHTDVAIARGQMEERYPLVMGHEGAGIVRDVGPDVESVQPGDHVVLGRIACGRCEYCRVGRSNLCTERTAARKRGTLRDGAVRFGDGDSRLHHCHGVSSFSEYTVVSEEVAIGITDEIPLREAALLGCGVLIGVGAVVNTVDIEPGSSVAVFGVGGVGASAIQAAAFRGATDLVAVDIVAEKLSLAESVGATATVDSSQSDPVDAVADVTGGEGVDYAFVTVGNPQVIEQAIGALRPTGRAVLVGTPPSGTTELSFDIHDFVVSERSMVGSFNGSYNLADAIPRLAALVADGKLELEPLITGDRPLDAVNESMAELESGSEIRQLIRP